jgi:2Fe-2S ferredoxin
LNFVVFAGQDRRVEIRGGETVLEAALRAGIEIMHQCGGNGSCGTCRVLVEEGVESIPPRNELEAEMAGDRGWRDNERLACQICPSGPLALILPP